MQQDQTITRNDPALQGLRQVPLALFILGVMLVRLGLIGPDRSIKLSFTLPLLLAMSLLWYGIGKYYQRVFGFVEPPTEKWTKVLSAFFLLLLYAGFLFLEVNSLAGAHPFPVSLSGIFVGVLYAGTGRNTHRSYYLAFGLLLVVESLLPLILGRRLDDPVFGTLGLVYGLTFGVGLLVISLVDHVRLANIERRWQQLDPLRSQANGIDEDESQE